jgi:hypothetical protein
MDIIYKYICVRVRPQISCLENLNMQWKMNLHFKKVKAKVKPTLKSTVNPIRAPTDIQ